MRMKWFGYLAAAGVLATLLTPSTARAQNTLPWLHTDGTKITNDKNEQVVLNGVNLGGWLVEEMWMMPFEPKAPAGSGMTDVKDHVSLWKTVEKRFGPTEMRRVRAALREAWVGPADFAKIRQSGMNCVRIPFTYDLLQEPDGFATLDHALDNAKANNLYVILDLHGAPGRQSGSDHTGQENINALFKSPNYIKETEALWTKIAARYKNHSEVAGYDLLNEPMGAPDAVSLQVVQDRLFRAVRTSDPRHIIIVEDGYKGPQTFPLPASVGWDNAVFSLHHYNFNAKSVQEQAQGLQNMAATAQQVSQNRNTPVFIGEFQIEPNGTPDVLAGGLKQWQQDGLSWTIWTYKTAMGGDSHGGMWGWIHADKPLNLLNPFTDSADELIKKAAQVRLQNMSENKAMTKAFSEAALVKPLPPAKELSPTAQTGPVSWQYTTDAPAANWFSPDFKAAGWKTGMSGFGEKPDELPAEWGRTAWTTSDIYLRRTVTIPANTVRLSLLVSHDDDAEIYINGVLAAKLDGYQHAYQSVAISPEALAAIKPGANVLAVHCHQNAGGQYIDVGLLGNVVGD